MVDQTTLRATFISESAAYQNTFGWYNSVTGLGGILFADVEAEGKNPAVVGGVSYADFTVNTADLPNIQFFLISDGYTLNKSDPDDLTGAIKVIKLSNGSWAVADVDAQGNVITDHGKPDILAGAGANALFTETSKNAGGVDYASSVIGTQQTAATLAGDTADGPTGMIAWEDTVAQRRGNTYSKPGDADYNDAVFQISVVSANRPPVANADAVTISEDAGPTTINVLANDTTPNPNDTLRITAVNTAGLLGTVTIAADGHSVLYKPAASFQSLAASQTATETFTYTIANNSGSTSTATTTVTIQGANDVATIGGVSTGSVTEDVAVTSASTLRTSGALTVSDVDTGQSSFVAQSAAAGTYGTFTLDSAGNWTYTAANGQSAIQSLGTGKTLTDSFTAVSFDGSASQTVTVTINGTNDIATIGGVTTGSVTEDVAVTSSNTLRTSGALTISDADAGQSSFIAQSAAAGTYGTFTLDAAGNWTYTAANGQSAVQSLGAGKTLTDSFTAVSFDGKTSQTVTVTINGTNDIATIGGVTTGSVTEDVAVTSSNTLRTSGALTISDADAGQSSFIAQSAAAGTYGTFTLDAAGNWTYTAANGQSAVQSLGAGKTLTDSFTAVSFDGKTSQTVTVTINGTNDIATIGGVTTGSVTEDVVTGNALRTSGALTVSDVDAGQAGFIAQTNTAGTYGTFTLDAAGNWTYTAANGQAAIQSLGAGQSLTDSFTAVSIDGTATKTVTVTLNGSIDTPTFVAAPAAGAADPATGRIPLSIDVSSVDANSVLSVRIDSVPSSFALSSGQQIDDGIWLVNKSDLPGLALVPVTTAPAGSFTLHVTAISTEGLSQAASAASDITLTIAPSANSQTGRVADGYIAGATVFADANHNGQLDAGEASTVTNADGSFTLSGGSGPLVMFGGTDVSTGVSFTGTLSAPEGSTVVTPLTTLINTLAATLVSNTVSATEAASLAATQVAAAFGLNSGVDLKTVDPVAAALQGDSSLLSAGIQVQSTVAQIAAVGAPTDAVFSAIASAITTAAASQQTPTIDLSNATVVTAIVTDAGVTGTKADVVVSTVAAAVDSIQAATDITTLAQAGQVAQGAAVTQLATTDYTNTTQVQALQDTFANPTNLSAQVAAAVPGDVNGATLGTLGNDVLDDHALTVSVSLDGLDGNDQVIGGSGNDYLYGGAGKDYLTGNAGNDLLDGGQGFDRAVYSTASSGVTVNLAAGTASGGADVGTDKLVAIEGIVGSNQADSYNATGFTGSSGVIGAPAGLNEFEGLGGDDTITGTVNASGALLTRLSYVSATASVTVDIAAGTTDGDASVGHDTFTNVFSVFGSGSADTLRGSANPFGTVEVFDGRAGNDLIDGRGGFDRADYNNDPSTATGITVNLAAGTVTGDASIGTDTLKSVEAVRGTNFADVYDATGFSGSSTNAGSNGTFNEFTGNGGDDTIIGNGNTRLGFNNATAGIVIDIAAGTDSGDSSVGHDTFTGVNAVVGSLFADTMYGDANNNVFTGVSGDDYIDGRDGFDTASYNNIYFTTDGVTVNMAAGIVTDRVAGDTSNGTDTLRSIEGVQGTVFADSYDATGYGVTGALNVGNNGTFNQFEGLGGDDIITGNGNTRVLYNNATGGVTVNLQAGTASGNASVGNDTITGGVNSVSGSGFGDTIIGDGGSNTLIGNGGNDIIDGGAGADIAIYNGPRANYTVNFNTPSPGQIQVVNTGNANGDGTDTLTNIEVVQFNNVSLLVASGSAVNPVDVSNGLFFGPNGTPLTSATGTANDFLTIGFSLSNHQINLGGGSGDTVNLAFSGGYNLNLVGVEKLNGSGGDDFVSLVNAANGLSVDLGGGGNDNLNLVGGANSLSVTNVEFLNATDFNGTASNDTVTLLNNVSGLNVNLAQGSNALNLFAGSNAFTAIYNVDTVTGTSSDDTLTVDSGLFGSTVDLGAGNDTLNLGFSSNVTVKNVETVNGSDGFDAITIANTAGTTTVTGGLGGDTLIASTGQDRFHYTSANDSSVFGPQDEIIGFDTSTDRFVFDGMSGGPAGFTGSIDFIGSNAFDGTAAARHSEARLDTSGGQTILQIDVNGDGVLDGSDMQILLSNLTGPLNNANFVVPNQAPTDIVLSSATVAENSAAGTVVGTLSSIDPDAGDTASFTLTNDAGGRFALSGANLVVAGPLDFETASSLQVGISVTDSAGHTFAKTLTVAVTDVNEAPTVTSGAAGSVAENAPASTVVYQASASDPDTTAPNNSISWSLGGADAAAFSIDAAGRVTLNAPADFEAKSSYAINVIASDGGGLPASKAVTINVTDVNEAPTVTSGASASVAENAPVSTFVYQATAADPDTTAPNNSISWSLGGTDAAAFSIDAAGHVTLNAPADYETKSSYAINVIATDGGGLSSSKAVTVGILNVNEAPTDISISNASIPQSTAVGTVVGSLSAIDPEGDAVTFSLVNGAGGQFSVVGSNLVVAGALSAGPQQVVIEATDAFGHAFDKAIPITVNVGATVVGTASNDVLSGTAGDDIIQGLAGNDRLTGGAGNDLLDGGTGFDRAVYSDATGPISITLASGTVTAPGDGTDTLVGIEGIVGTNFADTFIATGFAGVTGNPGTPVGFNDFEGLGGNDAITGAVNSQGGILTRISYASATAGVTVDLQAGTATGDASVGSDTFTNVNNVIGSGLADTLNGSNNPNGSVEVFDGRAGNDTFNGRGGFDRADYNNDSATTSGITVNMAGGTVTGDSTIGTDTLRSIEAVRGTNFADTYVATNFGAGSTNAGSLGTFNEFTGGGGSDSITGNGNTRINFSNATGGVTVDLVAGTADGDASVGHDTFTLVNAVLGSVFNDTISGDANNNTFSGLGGDDTMDGRGGFDTVTYNNIYLTTGGVTVNFAAGTATGDSSIGNDTLRSIEAIQGTNFADTFVATGFGLAGALNIGNNGNFNQFEGMGGNDTITGNGNTRLIFSNATGGVSIDLQAGTDTGDASVGTDSFIGVNSVTGSSFGDTYVATGFTGVSAAGSFGPFNLFEGQGGNDIITGNGNTRIAFNNATAGVTVDLGAGTARGTANGDTAGVGFDTITGGVNSVQGSNFADIITGGTGNDTLFGGGGNDTLNGGLGSDTITGGAGSDTIDGGAGTDMAVFTGVKSNYTISFDTPAAGQIQVLNIGNANSDGTDVLTNVEMLQFADGFVMVAPGSQASPIDSSSLNLFGNTLGITGTAGNDFLAVGFNIFGHAIDLGAGTGDTVSLAVTAGVTLNLANVEFLTGSSGDDFVALANQVNGLAVDLGGGNDTLALANGSNSVSVTNVEAINGSDFDVNSPSNDALTLLNTVSGITVNLGNGTNTLNLAAGSNSLDFGFGVQVFNGTGSDDTLTLTNGTFGSTIDLGGGNDTLNLGNGSNVTVNNIETVNGSSGWDTIVIANTTGTTTVTGGQGSDFMTASAAADSFRYTAVAESGFGSGVQDQIVNFNAAQDSFVFSGMAGGPNGFTGPITFVGTSAFDGNAASHQSEARLEISGNQTFLQVDVDGDGAMTAQDMQVELVNLTGALHSSNFLLT
jgi:VCBS repeat-containing protein